MGMEIRDYNGTGRWSLQSIRERYAKYARQFKLAAPLDLVPMKNEEREIRWIYPVMFQVIEGIERGDKACIEIGVECLVENQWLAFGRIIKANTARALRRSTLAPDQVERLRKLIVSMLIEEHIPGHFRDYAKLLRKIGLGDWWPIIEARANRGNPYVFRFYRYLQQHAGRE